MASNSSLQITTHILTALIMLRNDKILTSFGFGIFHVGKRKYNYQELEIIMKNVIKFPKCCFTFCSKLFTSSISFLSIYERKTARILPANFKVLWFPCSFHLRCFCSYF